MVTTALTVVENDALTRYEAQIEDGLSRFAEVGQALAAIKKGRLYRTVASTFEDYCKARWGFKRAHAYRLIEAAQIVAEMSPSGRRLVKNERQARALKDVAPEDREEAAANRLADLQRRSAPTTAEVEAEEEQIVTSAKSREDAEDCQDLLRWLGNWIEKGRRRMGASRWSLGKLPKQADAMAEELGKVTGQLLG